LTAVSRFMNAYWTGPSCRRRGLERGLHVWGTSRVGELLEGVEVGEFHHRASSARMGWSRGSSRGNRGSAPGLAPCLRAARRPSSRCDPPDSTVQRL
jgi:hypothetical protein